MCFCITIVYRIRVKSREIIERSNTSDNDFQGGFGSYKRLDYALQWHRARSARDAKLPFTAACETLLRFERLRGLYF